MSRRHHSASRTNERLRLDSEPEPDGEEWVEWGGQLMWVAGWTEGGAPFGLSYEEWRHALRADEAQAGWARALSVLEELVSLQSGRDAVVEVGRVVKIGEGLSRDVFGAEVTVRPDRERISGQYVVLLPRAQAPLELNARTRRELRLLAWLQGRCDRFRVPRPLGALPEYRGIALARAFVRGIPLDMRAGRQPSVKPWQVVGEIAASMHGIDVSSVPPFVEGFSTRRDHALAALATLDELDVAEIKDARAWALEHLPPSDEASLLHGDLLGQNILLDPGASPAFAVIDWECATRGDPARDLAIVTRGARQPFQIAGGLDRLLDAYAAAGGRLVTRAHVRIHELALAGLWYREALGWPRGGGRPGEEALALVRRVLKMACAG